MPSLVAVAAKLILFLSGAAGLAALVRGWQPAVRWRHAAGHALLVLAFLAPSLLTPGHQVATDMVERWRPWSEAAAPGAGESGAGPANPLLVDPVLQMLPFRTLVRQRLLGGEAPLWAHELGTGQPLLGNAQSAPFAPLHLAALPLPTLAGMSVAAAWQLLVALLLTHALLLHLGARPAAAGFAAVTYGLGLFLVVWLYYPLGMTAAWLPGVVLGLRALARGERGAVAGTAACGVAMAASGHPETLAHAGVVGAVLVAVLAVRRPAAERWGFLCRLAVAALLAVLLAAPVLGPVLEALPESQRMAALEQRPDAVHAPPFEPAMLLAVVHPFAFGSPRDGDWTGPWNFNELMPAYAGLLPLLLALTGALWLRGRVLALVAGGLAALLAALGLPPFFDLVSAVPFLDNAAHGRLRLVWLLAVAVAAGLTLDALQERRRQGRIQEGGGPGSDEVGGGATGGRFGGGRPGAPPQRARTRSAAGRGPLREGGLAGARPSWLLAAGALVVAGLLLAAPSPGAPWQRTWWLVALAGLALVAVLPTWPALRRRRLWLAWGFLLADLFLVGVRYNPALPPEAAPGAPPALAALVEAARVESGDRPVRVLAEEWDLPANLPALYGLWDPRGNDPMRPAAAARWVSRRLEGRGRGLAAPRLRPGRFDHDALHFLSVGWLLSPHRREMPPPWRLVAHDTGGKVWHNPVARPLWFFPHGGGVVESVAPESNGFRVVVDSEGEALLGSSVSWSRGWRASVDGDPRAPRPFRHAFLSVPVPAGRHEVVLRYAPASWTWGLAAAGLGLLLAMGLGLLSAARGRGWRRGGEPRG